jgi:hypothetical protein
LTVASAMTGAESECNAAATVRSQGLEQVGEDDGDDAMSSKMHLFFSTLDKVLDESPGGTPSKAVVISQWTGFLDLLQEQLVSQGPCRPSVCWVVCIVCSFYGGMRAVQ